MDAENASLGDERRARREEYGHGQRTSESRGFAGFGSNGFEAAEGSNGATNRPESVPDRGYTWTPAPLSSPQPDRQNTGGSAALDPFAAWNTSGVIGDAVQTMNPGEPESNSRFTTPPADGPPYVPDDGPETAALHTRSTDPAGAGSADSTSFPQISQPGAPGPAYSSSPRIPAPGPYQADPPSSGELTVPSGNPGQLSGAETTQLPTADTGSLPSWLSSIGEEPVPQSLESGGRRRKVEFTESAESGDQFNPFEDQHTPDEPAAAADTPYEVPATEDDPYPLPAAATTEPAPALPTRTSHAQAPAPAGTGDDSAAPALPARRLPRSAARHAPAGGAETTAPGTGETPAAHGIAETGAPGALSGPADSGDPETRPSRESQSPRRLPRSASRYTPDNERAEERDPDSAAFGTIGPVSDTDPATARPETEAPPRLGPPEEKTPILDRLLDPEPAHSTESGDDSESAPVAELLTRILESEQDAPGSRHAEPNTPEPAAADTPAPARRTSASPLTLVPDEDGASTPDALTGDDSRPPLETRRSRRAREAAETGPAASADRPAPAPELAPVLSAPRGGSAPADTSRHSRSEEGADIDIHLIMRLLTASDDLEVLAGQAETGEVSAAEVARAAREARSAVLSAVSAWYGGPAQMVKFANALLQAARES
ncbi:hypothetical protein [Nocardia carnea]|uniref:hypothetical protein n=1 Tax=Nocardia carnea TaxID=37328 RepID=UPI00245595AD|nr:hypothetical protein [Nocardia carnea]